MANYNLKTPERPVGLLQAVEKLMYWAQISLPAVYGEELTYAKEQGKMAEKINEVVEQLNVNTEWTEYLLNEGVEAETVTYINELIENGTIANLINNVLLGDMNKKLDDAINEITNKVNSIVTPSPAGVYNTINDIPSNADKTRIYLISTGDIAGHWVYWSGSAWIDGGLYQSMVIENDSIDMIQTKFRSMFNYGVNYFTKFNWLTNFIYISGTLTAMEGVNCSRVSNILPGTKVYLSSFKNGSPTGQVGPTGIRVSFWKMGASFAESTWLSDLSGAETLNKDYITVPANADGISVGYYNNDPYKQIYFWNEELNYNEDLDISKELKINEYTHGYMKIGAYDASGVWSDRADVETLFYFIDVNPGDIVFSNAFTYTDPSTSVTSIRIPLFLNGTWVNSIPVQDSAGKEFVVIPNGCNQYKMSFWTSQPITERQFGTIRKGSYRHQILLGGTYDAQSSLLNKKISILGDSISTFAGWTPEGNRNRYPQDNLITDVNLTWWKKLIDSNGALLGVNDSWAGTRFSNNSPTDTGDVGPNRCMSSTFRINRLGGNGAPDYIFIFGGTNDLHFNEPIGAWEPDDPQNLTEAEINALTNNTIASALKATILKCQFKYKNAKIIFMSPYFMGPAWSSGGESSNTPYFSITQLTSLINLEKSIVEYYGGQFVDLRACGNSLYNTTTTLGDGIHPVAYGMNLIYEEIMRQIVW